MRGASLLIIQFFLVLFSRSALCSEVYWGNELIAAERSDMIVDPQSCMKAQIDEDDKEQIEAFLGVLDVIDMICERALLLPNEEVKRRFAATWFDVLYTIASEKRSEQDLLEESILEPATSSLKFIAPFTQRKEEVWSEGFDLFSKSKMMKAGSNESDEKSLDNYDDDFESTESEHGLPMMRRFSSSSLIERTSLINDEKEEEKLSEDGLDSDYENESSHGKTAVRFGHFRRKSPSYPAQNIRFPRINELDNAAASVVAVASVPETADMKATGDTATIDLEQLQRQLQEQIMEQLLSRLGGMSAEQLLGGANGSLIQSERELLQAAMEVDSNGLPQMDKESLLRYIKTSSLPKLINSAVKGKTGVDVLKSLALGLKVFNETLGIVEVILKVILKTTKTVRFYALSAAEVVAEMAREDDMKPSVDLSVSLKSKTTNSKTSRFGGIAKAFKNGFKRIEDGTAQATAENDPFTISIQAALSKSRDFTVEFHKLPDTLMLRLIHTIFAELHKRDGVVRFALAGKKHKTLLGLQTSVTLAVEEIYEAIGENHPESIEFLHFLPTSIFTDILISLISTIKMDPVHLSAHINQVTCWIKPMLAILDQEAQLNLLKYLLTDPEAEAALRQAQGLPFSTTTKINWSLSKRRHPADHHILKSTNNSIGTTDASI